MQMATDGWVVLPPPTARFKYSTSEQSGIGDVSAGMASWAVTE